MTYRKHPILHQVVLQQEWKESLGVLTQLPPDCEFIFASPQVCPPASWEVTICSSCTSDHTVGILTYNKAHRLVFSTV